MVIFHNPIYVRYLISYLHDNVYVHLDAIFVYLSKFGSLACRKESDYGVTALPEECCCPQPGFTHVKKGR